MFFLFIADVFASNFPPTKQNKNKQSNKHKNVPFDSFCRLYTRSKEQVGFISQL